jgi:hypothetical protein
VVVGQCGHLGEAKVSAKSFGWHWAIKWALLPVSQAWSVPYGIRTNK